MISRLRLWTDFCEFLTILFDFKFTIYRTETPNPADSKRFRCTATSPRQWTVLSDRFRLYSVRTATHSRSHVMSTASPQTCAGSRTCVVARAQYTSESMTRSHTNQSCPRPAEYMPRHAKHHRPVTRRTGGGPPTVGKRRKLPDSDCRPRDKSTGGRLSFILLSKILHFIVYHALHTILLTDSIVVFVFKNFMTQI